MKRFFNVYTLIAIACSFLLLSCAGSKKSKVDPYIGDWEYTAVTPDRSIEVTMTIVKNEDSYTGTLNSDMGSADIQDLKIEDNRLTGWFAMESYQLSVKGDFEGNKFTGITSIDEYEIPMNATKKLDD